MTALREVLLGFLLLAVTYGQTNRGPLLDSIIRDALEKARPQLKNLEIPDQNFNITNSQLNVTAQFYNGLAKGLDKFVLQKLSTTLIPLKVTNFTITMDEVEVTGVYGLNGTAMIPGLPGNMTVFGNGDARVVLKDIFFTIAADFVFTGGKFQIPPKGLHGFHVSLLKSEVDIENLLGGGEMGKLINDFLGFFIPDVVRDYNKTFFELVRDPLIKIINEALAQEKPPC